MNKYILILITVLISACGFNSDDNGVIEEETTILTLQDSDDSDGDLVSNGQEKKLGRDPLIAEIPNVRALFLQNYKVIGTAKNKESGKVSEFIIDTKVGRDDPDFKFRVGDLFIRDRAIKEAAKIGRFSGHSSGSIKEQDYSLIKYPDVDPRFYLNKTLGLKKYFDRERYDITSLKVEIESNLKLQDSAFYKSIKNLSINFYYFDYEKEKLEKISTVTVDRNFEAGVNEVFSVVIDEIPQNLLADNYLKRGEFIISEINDYEVSELKTTYKALMKSVRSKSLPVVINTPLESTLKYVGLNGTRFRLSQVFNILFPKDYEIKNNQVTKVGQFTNNLPAYEYLNELSGMDKKGKWFTFSNAINRPLLDYTFKTTDYLSLSYITGDKLSKQVGEGIYSIRDEAASNEGGTILPLGNIKANSHIEIQIAPRRVWGNHVEYASGQLSSNGGSCGNNCISADFYCDFETHIFSTIDKDLIFNKNLEKEFDRIFLIINEKEFLLRDLIAKSFIKAKFEGENFHIEIDNLSLITDVDNVNENVISFKFLPIDKEVFNGHKLVKAGGPHSGACLKHLLGMARQAGCYGQWQHQVNWNVISSSGRKHYFQRFSLGISAIVKNFYN
jgi:hypothetical protein